MMILNSTCLKELLERFSDIIQGRSLAHGKCSKLLTTFPSLVPQVRLSPLYSRGHWGLEGWGDSGCPCSFSLPCPNGTRFYPYGWEQQLGSRWGGTASRFFCFERIHEKQQASGHVAKNPGQHSPAQSGLFSHPQLQFTQIFMRIAKWNTTRKWKIISDVAFNPQL